MASSPSLSDAESRQLAETPIDRTLGRIEAMKNAYWDSKTALFGFAYRTDRLNNDEQLAYIDSLKNTLYCARWFLEVISSKVLSQDSDKYVKFVKFFVNYQVTQGGTDGLFKMLHDYDLFIAPYLDHWKQESVGLLMIGGR